MGRLSWIAGTAAFITLAWLLLVMTHLSKKEYTEEIERLRRDLAATREKNGVYLDSGEYEKLTLKVSTLEREMLEKYALIKALRDEAEKMEELCSSLHIEVNEKKNELTQKTELLNEAEDCLEHTKSALVSTEMEKQVTEQLVSYHEDKEKQLSEQAHSIMRVADQSTMDSSLLHDKLSRKRSVEEGNKSRGENFRHKFTRSVNHMENSLEKLISDHSAFCVNLRTTLGDLQGQKTSELTIMSEHLTKQVQLFMDLLHNMEEKSADAMRSAQHWIQSHLGFVRAMGTSVEDFRASVMELVQAPLQGISDQLRTAVMDLQGLSNEVNDKIRDREYQLEVYSLEAKDSLNGMEESMAQYVAQRKQESERLVNIRHNMLEDSEAEDKDMLLQLRILAETVQRLEERTHARQQRANQSNNELSAGLSHIDSLTENIAGEVHKTTDSLRRKLTKFVTAEKQTSEDLQKTLREFVEKRMVSTSQLESLREEAVAGCWSALNSHEEERRQYYQSTEDQLRDHSEMLKRYLQSENEQTQTLAAKVRETAEVQESHLESQRSSFRSFMQQRQDELEEDCSIVRERGHLLSDELRRRESELMHFFTSELLEDRPTGETPPRRDYIYPRKVIVSSPKEIVIKRIQAQMDPPKAFKSALDSSYLYRKSTTSLPEAVEDQLSVSLPQKQELSRSASDSNVPLVVENSNFGDELENRENRKVTNVRAAKTKIREPRTKLKLRLPLSEKNDD